MSISFLTKIGKFYSKIPWEKIPWEEIKKALKTLYALATIYLGEIKRKVATLEEFANQQSQFNTEVTKQLTILVGASKTLSSRLNLFIWIATIEMVLILILIIKVFF